MELLQKFQGSNTTINPLETPTIHFSIEVNIIKYMEYLNLWVSFPNNSFKIIQFNFSKKKSKSFEQLLQFSL